MNKISLLYGILIIFIGVVAPAQAFESSGEYTEEGIQWMNAHWGENISLGDLARIAYTPENYQQIVKNVPKDQLDKVWSQPYYWGSRYPWGAEDYPKCPYGANVWDENGPVNIGNLNLSQKLDLNLENAVTDKSGCRIIGYMDQSVTQGEMKPFHREMPEGLDRFTYDLFWQDANSSLKLTIFAPDGKMGPYYDESDGKKNGRIYVQVFRPEGIAAGDWYAVVEGEHVKKAQHFMLLVT